jgi:hypothetical protein
MVQEGGDWQGERKKPADAKRRGQAVRPPREARKASGGGAPRAIKSK